MNHRPLFRVFLKAVGVLLIGSVIPDIGAWVIYIALIAARIIPMQSSPADSACAVIWLTVDLALGLYLFFGGEWLVNTAIPRNRSYYYGGARYYSPYYQHHYDVTSEDEKKIRGRMGLGDLKNRLFGNHRKLKEEPETPVEITNG